MTRHFAEGHGLEAGGLFNLGSGEANTWLTLTRAIFGALNRPAAIDFIDMPEVLRGKYQYFTQADISKLRGSGYLSPVTPLAEAVRDYVQGYLGPGSPPRGLIPRHGTPPPDSVQRSSNSSFRNAISALHLPWICRAMRPAGPTPGSVSV